MSLVLTDPTSLVAVNDQCEMVEKWAESCDSVAELQDAAHRMAAIDEYLNRTSIEGRGRIAATMRRLEVRIGRLLGKPLGGPGRGNKRIHHDESFSPQQRHSFRRMAEHADLVELLASESTDESPLSRRKVEQAIADAEREIEQRREASEWIKATEARLQPEDFNPALDAELARQRGALHRLCTDITKLGDPDDFVDQQADYLGRLTSSLSTIQAAHEWLGQLITNLGGSR